jgi:hypothetical protein
MQTLSVQYRPCSVGTDHPNVLRSDLIKVPDERDAWFLAQEELVVYIGTESGSGADPGDVFEADTD